MPPIQMGHRGCSCQVVDHDIQFVALTGGPGGGKTALLEIAERIFCRHVAVLPEAASIIFSGGFPRHDSDSARQAAQKAIFHVQRQLEQLMRDEDDVALVLCDRSTIDGLAYWPQGGESYWDALETTQAEELSHYSGVIHLETPDELHGYNRENKLRTESALSAREIDKAIAEAWKGHPRRLVVPSSERFLDKVQLAISHIGDLVPPCCG
jgi:predicted ATPase